MERRKRTTMMIDSDDEADDILGELHQPKPKKRKESQREVSDIAEGPTDFIQALTDSGYYPRKGNLPNVLGVPQSDFQHKLREHLVNSLHFPRNVEFFVSECDQFLNDKQNLIKALHPTENATEESSTMMTLPQDSLIHLLLNIDEVQPKLMTCILKRFAKAAREEKTAANEANLPSLLLSQMAWLNRIVDPALIVDTLLDLLNSTSTAIKKEIISHLPGLVADKEQIRVAFALAELLNEDTNALTAAILDALGDLNLPAVEAAELRSKVVKRILAVPLETVPVLLNFIFKRIQMDEASYLINEVRQNLDKAFQNKRNNERTTKESINDCISLSVEALQNAMIRSKSLGDTWFKEIQTRSDAREHYCADLLILIIQHKLTGRRRGVETLLKKKLRTEILSTETVKQTFQLYSSVLKNYFEQLRAIADSLLLASDPLIVSYGSLFYQEMFVHFEEFYQQEVVEALIQHVCCGGESASSAASPAAAALTVLQELSESGWEQLARFSAFIVTLLEYIEYMALPQVKRVMELLAAMSYGFSSTDESKTKLASFSAAIQSELLMIIKKQLSHTRVEFQRMGIIGSVALVHVLANPELIDGVGSDSQFDQIPTIDARRTGVLNGRERLILARSIIDMVNDSTVRCPEVAALFMDEMASASLIYDIHPSLYRFLNEQITEKFQDNFVVDEEQQFDNLSIPLSLQYGLDAAEVETSNMTLLFLNIGPMAIKEQNRKAGERSSEPTLTTLMSHIRLMRNIIDSYDQANLEDIDALLGCALCLPKEDITDEYEMMTPNEKDVVCRCLFYAVNWLIEIINTFARSKDMRAKVIQRLRDIVELKDRFYRCLAKNTTFMPPPCVFLGEAVRSRTNAAPAGKKPAAGKKATGKKGKGGKKTVDDGKDISPNKTVIHSTPINSMVLTGKLDFTGTQGPSAEAAVHSTYVIHFRELDLSAFLLLSSSLELSASEASNSVGLKAKDLELLLGDLSSKLEHKLLSAASKRQFPLRPGAADKESFAMLDLYSPLDVARRTIPLIRRLASHLETVSGYFQQLIDMNDGVLDGPEMFNDLAVRLGNCCYLIFRIINRMLSWHEFQKPSGAALLEDGLRYLATRLRENAKTASFTELHAASFDYIEKFVSSLPSFGCAVEHVHLLSSLHRILPSEDLSERLASVAEKYLKRAWHIANGELEKGPKFNQGVESLLQVYLLNGPSTIDKLEIVVKTAMTDVLEAGSEDFAANEDTFRTCNKNTFPVYFRASLLALVEVVRKINSPSSSPRTVKSTLAAWAKAVDILNHLVVTVKTLDRRSILTSCLKHGRAVVEHFYRSAMPLLDKQFKNFPTEAQELLKSLQVSTRTLQTVCNHAKTSRDASLAVHVPAIKRIQEQLLYRVKAMLAANGCASAFWAGNLKNKNLKGQEILSQSINGGSDVSGDEQSGSDEAEQEDSDDEVTVMNDNRVDEDDDSRSREF